MKMNQLIACLSVVIIFFSFPRTNIAQCSDFRILDYSNGKVGTQRMWNGYESGCTEIIKEWEGQNLPWVDESDYMKSEINYFKKEMESIPTKNSFESNLQTIKNDNDVFQKIISLNEIYKQKSDTIINLIELSYKNCQSSQMKISFAKLLYFFNDDRAKQILIRLCFDTCKYVRLEAARSLSYINEKQIACNTLISLWNLNDPTINLDRFNYFTVGMRNIGTDQSIDFLIKLTGNNNPFCVLDASVCLFQLKKKDECLVGIKHVLQSTNSRLFISAALVLSKFYSSDIIRTEIIPYKRSLDKSIASFTDCILGNIENN